MPAEDFVGIDVSKDSLEIAFRPSNKFWPTDHIAPGRVLRLRFQPWLPRHRNGRGRPCSITTAT